MFPYRLKMLREENGWTQEDMSIKTGISNVSISRYEQGVRVNPGLSELRKICTAFNVSIDYITGMSDERYPVNKKEMDEIFISLNEDNKRKIIEYAKFILSGQEVTK